MKKIDITGQKFARLLVIKESKPHISSGGNKYRAWLCECDCGKVTKVKQSRITSGHTKSCGCLQKEKAQINGKSTITHNSSNHPLYAIWRCMINRCYNRKNKEYKYYGKRGISVCDRWHDVRNFIHDMHPKPKGMSIDRIDNNGMYSPRNCRWSTRIQQSNNKRNNIMFKHKGEEKTLAEWCRAYSVNYKTTWNRLNSGWNFAEALGIKK